MYFSDNRKYLSKEKIMATIPKDPWMLLSYVNTQLRDFYSSLEELCGELRVDQEELEKKLGAVDYHYSREKNQFI